MDKKICELKLDEIKAAAGGRRMTASASINVTASAMYQPSKQVSQPSHHELLLAKR